jgi:hypothetical protein
MLLAENSVANYLDFFKGKFLLFDFLHPIVDLLEGRLYEIEIYKVFWTVLGLDKDSSLFKNLETLM